MSAILKLFVLFLLNIWNIMNDANMEETFKSTVIFVDME